MDSRVTSVPFSIFGTWHEWARLPSWFEQGCDGAGKAEYLPIPGNNQSFRVINTCSLRNRPSEILTAHGIATMADNSGDRYKIVFQGQPASIPPADYWIEAKSLDGACILVGGPSRQFLWVLGRSPVASQSYLSQMLSIAREKGYPVERLEIFS